MPRGVRLNPEHDERTRAKIQTSQIINRLQSFIFGEVKMEPPQVTAALGLLKKTLPDMTESKITHIKQDAVDYTREELVALLAQSDSANGSEGTASENGCGSEPDSIH